MMENSKMLPDKTDRAILRELQKDGRISNVELARRVNLSESACLRRVRVLEEEGVIDGYVGLVNSAKAGLPGNVFVRITLQRQQQKDLEEFEAAVQRVPEVMECYLMTGDSNYLLRVWSPTRRILNAFTISNSPVRRQWPGCNRASPCVP